jgi:polar amino acid transport system substrate-binding protein
MKLTTLFILLSLLSYTSQGIAVEKQVRLASSEYPPYFGENLKNNGFISEIIVEAFKEANYQVEVEFFPWARGLELTKRGKYDGMLALWYRKEREQWFVYSAPLPPNEIVFYKRKKDKITFNTYQDLKPYSIGIVRGYANPPDFEKSDFLEKQEVTSDEQNLRKLFLKRIDLALIDRLLAKNIIDTKFPEYAEELEWMSPPLKIDIQYLVISKKAKNYRIKLDDFNSGLKQLSEKGMIEKIMAKHGFAED